MSFAAAFGGRMLVTGDEVVLVWSRDGKLRGYLNGSPLSAAQTLQATDAPSPAALPEVAASSAVKAHPSDVVRTDDPSVLMTSTGAVGLLSRPLILS
jgi:hypothetical protein